MTRLSVSTNKVTTLHDVRGGDTPSVILATRRYQEFGAEGIIVHPGPGEWHITHQDVRDLREVVTTEFDIEGYPSDPLLDLIYSVRPEQVTLIPDRPDALASDSGWAVADCRDLLKPIVKRLKQAGIRVSLFIGTDPRRIETTAEVGADRMGLCTEPYASQMVQSGDPRVIVAPFAKAARVARRVSLGVNAGHNLNRDNLAYFVQHVTPLDKVSIGRALTNDALYLGLEETIARYLRQTRSNS